MPIKVSIITTYYNSVTLGDFVHKTMRFLRSQTYQNLELICVHDGSTDETLEQLREYESQDPRIKIIDKPNEGTAQYAKAAGQDAATGDFIMLMDHDDELSLDAVEQALQAFTLHPELDFVNFIVDVRYENGTRKGLHSLDRTLHDFGDFRFQTISGREALLKTAGVWDIQLRGLYRAEIFCKESFRFTKKLLNADEIVERLLLRHMKLIGNCSGIYTHYVLPNSSAKTKNIKQIDIIETDLFLRDFFKKENIYPERKSLFERTAYFNLLDAVKIYHLFKKELQRDERQRLHTLLHTSFRHLDFNEVLRGFPRWPKLYHQFITRDFTVLMNFYAVKTKIFR